MLAAALIVFVLAGTSWWATAGIALAGAWLAPPFAAWLAARHGEAGFRTATGAALVMVPIWAKFGPLQVGGEPAICALALVAAGFAHRGPGAAALARGFVGARERRLLPVALIALPLGFGVLPKAEWNELATQFAWAALPLLAPLAAWAGFRGLRAGAVALPLAVAAAIGATLALVGQSGHRLATGAAEWEVWYSLVEPRHWLLAAAAFVTGRALARVARGEPPGAAWARPALAGAALTLLWFGVGGFDAVRLPAPLPRYLGFLGATAALPLAAFALGALAGRRGIATAASFALAAPLLALAIALAWGALGARAFGRLAAWPSLGAPASFGLVLVALVALLEPEEIGALALAIAGAAAAALVAWAGARFAAATGVTAEGWLPVLTLLTLGPVLAMQLAGAITMLPSGHDVLFEYDAFTLVAAAAILLLLGAIAWQVVRGALWLPKVARDVARLARFAAGRR